MPGISPVRAPLTGIVLMVEMTGQYALVLPLALASAVAYGVAEYLRDPPIYQALLEPELFYHMGFVRLGYRWRV